MSSTAPTDESPPMGVAPRPEVAPRGHRGAPERAEDWSNRVHGPRGLAQHLWLVARMFDNYAEADLDLFHRYGDVIRFALPNPGVLFCRPRHVRHVLKTNVL
ncbi:MAG: hypothetical protein RIF41_02525, partial [Polyangiaceae bacterium]